MMSLNLVHSARALVGAVIITLIAPAGATLAADKETYDQTEIVNAATNFFGETTEGLANIVQKVFDDLGQPNAYIAGEEVSGAIGIGLRYGKGALNQKAGETSQVFWQGPSIGFDFGGNASKVFVLVYNLSSSDELFQRYPALDGSFYFVAGVGANYHQSGNVILAPVRTGAGFRAGVNVGYLHYTKKHSWIPL